MVLRYVGAVAVDGACVRVPVPREAVGPDGIITDPEIRTALGAALRRPRRGSHPVRSVIRSGPARY